MAQTSSQSTVNKIEMRLRGKGRGSIVFQQDYADCGTPSAVKSTFHRMYTDGMLVRLAHGIYYYPKEDKEYGLGIIYPSVEDIAQAIAKRDKAKIVPMGAYALNRLGLSTQMPMNVVFLTNGAPRRIKIGNGCGILNNEPQQYCKQKQINCPGPTRLPVRSGDFNVQLPFVNDFLIVFV